MNVETYYFAIINGNQIGPVSKTNLKAEGLTPETYVWREGMKDWVKAVELPELADLFVEDSAFGGYARVEEPFAYNSMNHYAPIPHTNWLPWAIVGTVVGSLFSCIALIFGAIGINRAMSANKFYDIGNKELGDRANSSARTMSIVALVLGGLGFIMYVTGVTENVMKQLMSGI